MGYEQFAETPDDLEKLASSLRRRIQEHDVKRAELERALEVVLEKLRIVKGGA
jgi:hypothetical protein